MASSLVRNAISTLAIASLAVFSSCSDDDDPPPNTANVSGAVTSGGNALDQYVTLLFTPTANGALLSVTADADGNYSAKLVEGTYRVESHRAGYELFTQLGYAVTAGTPATLDIAMTELPDYEYIGSAQCATCHDDHYDTFRQSGHPFKLNKVDGAAPVYPFTALPEDIIARLADDDQDIPDGLADPGVGTDNPQRTPASWNDITYVIGGFFWKARFIDTDGYIVTGTETQYNYATDGMVAYHNNEDDKAFNCGNCHTTGWKHYDSTVNPHRQDDLPGMHGTFAEQGIGCEACHGGGAKHARTMAAADITLVASSRTAADYNNGMFGYGTPQSCEDCHTRDGERDWRGEGNPANFKSNFDLALEAANMDPVASGGRIAASGGMVKHHEQGDELLGINPDTLLSTRSPAFMATHGNCMTCHGGDNGDPHGAVVHAGEDGIRSIGVDPSSDMCLSCHTDKNPENNFRTSMRSLDCADCHMPQSGKSAVKTTLPNGVSLGDVTSHVFTINLDGQQLTDEGNFSYPWLGGDWACRNCHGDGTTFPISDDAIDGFRFHTAAPQ